MPGLVVAQYKFQIAEQQLLIPQFLKITEDQLQIILLPWGEQSVYIVATVIERLSSVTPNLLAIRLQPILTIMKVLGQRSILKDL